MRVKITKPCVLECLPGSEVEVTEKQLRFILKYCEPIEVRETPETPKKQTRKGKK